MIDAKIAKIKAEFEKLGEELQNPKIISDPQNLQKIARRRAELSRIVSESERLAEVQKRISETKQLQESESSDELRELARDELEKLTIEEKSLKKSLEILLLPTDPDNEKNVILEIRAGTGGDEAELFAADLFRMYSRYAETKGWKINILNSHRTGIGGIKEISAEISGTEPYRFLKYESGVHRVQRIPKTEKAGRVHTSAVSVVVLPEAEEVDIEIDPKDLKIDTFRSSGAGGQHVNVTDSAVRITHIPTNTVVSCQDERSQLKNKEKALKILRSRIYEHKREEKAKREASLRKTMIGTGDRSEKIRTYNIPQNRVTDHRIKQNFPADRVISGNLDALISSIMDKDDQKKLELMQNESI